MKNLLKSKKGNINLLAPAIISLVLAAIILVFGMVMSQELRDTQDSGTEAYIAANKTIVGLGTFADFWEIMVLAIIITIVIGLLLITLGGGGRKAR